MQALRPVRLALGLVLLVFLASGPAGASEQKAPGLTLHRVTVAAKWREGWLKGSVSFGGTVGAPAQLTAVLRRVAGGSLPRTLDFTARRAGTFTAKLMLPARPLPGAYRLRVSGLSDVGVLPAVARNVTVPAPVEGIVDRAVASAKRGGRRARLVSGPRHVLFARFHFLVRPRAQRVNVIWRAPSYDLFVARWQPYTPTVYTRVRSSGTPLERGVWYCLLRAGGRVAKRLAIRIK